MTKQETIQEQIKKAETLKELVTELNYTLNSVNTWFDTHDGDTLDKAEEIQQRYIRNSIGALEQIYDIRCEMNYRLRKLQK